MCRAVKRNLDIGPVRIHAGLQNARSCGFTLIELLVTIVVLGVVTALTVQAILPVRREGHRIKCLVHARHNTMSAFAYATDHRDAFPAPVPTSSNYYGSIGQIMNSYWWEGYSGHSRESPLLRCPAHTPQRDYAYTRHVDYSLSVALYVRAEVMTPELSGARRRISSVARVNRVGDILYPAQKSVVFEQFVWHDWDGAVIQNRPNIVNQLLHGGTRGRLSVCYADGHARSHAPRESAGWVLVRGFGPGGPFSSTIHGVRGVDIR